MYQSNRLVIYAKDLMIITGRSKRTALRILERIRKRFNRPPRSMVTVHDFCAYSGIPEERVREILA